MPNTAATLLDILARRVRDPSNVAHPRDFARDVLSRCQRVLNASLELVTREDTLVLAAGTPQVYNVTATLPNAIRLVAIREGTRQLARVDWAMLGAADPGWPLRLADSFVAWSLVGRDRLLLYPGVPQTGGRETVTVVSVGLTTVLSADTTELQLPNHTHTLLLDLAEAVLLLRDRQFESFDDVVERLAPRAVEAVRAGQG